MSRWINSWFGGKLPAGSRLAQLGDSLVHAMHGPSQTSYICPAINHAEMLWARAMHPRMNASTVHSDVATIGGRFIRGSNCAVQGAHVSSIQAIDVEEQRDVALEYAPRVVFIAAGTNDLSANKASATLQTDIQSQVEFFISRGIRVILSTIRPRLVSAEWPEGNARWTRLSEVNAWIRSYCASGRPGLYLFDPWSDLLDAEAAQAGSVQSQYVYDTVHLNATGAQVSGARLATVIDRVFASGVFWDMDSPSLLPGAAMTGTGGGKQGATGDVANGWIVQKDGAVPGNIPVVCSKINSDTTMQLVFTANGGGTGIEGCNIVCTPGTVNLTAGRWYQMMVPVDFEASPLWRVQSVQMRTIDDRYHYGHTSRDTITPIPEAWSGWLVTEPLFIRPGDEAIRPSLRIVMARGIAATATMRMHAGARLIEVPAP
jgi:lysophospholipase L1-like esterase